MGCCLGTAKTQNPPPPHHHPNGPNNSHFHARSSLAEPHPTRIPKPQLRAAAPPNSRPPVVEIEEESVKEVLSETPIFKPQIPKITPEKDTHSPPKLQPEQPPKELAVDIAVPAEPSQASEPCGVTLSESFSYSTATTATTITDARDDEVTSKQKRDAGPRVHGASSTAARSKRPYSGDLATRRERAARPLARASEPSIGKRNRTETSSFRGRESGQLSTLQQRSGGPTGVRRDTVSSRSRSPATRTAGGVGRGGRGRSPSASKVTGPAGGSSSQLGVGGVEKQGKTKKEEEPNGAVVQQGNEGKTRKEEEPNGEVSQLGNEGKTRKEDESHGGVAQQGNESSIDNPLVSLECFIFV
ncbi:translation initiation factor IF-2 [Pyrus x bretschneideri]|uniref:translation initiation factor IF-2 n=1 Tax=Pyrus x bretschneideri TaxID=225117 RepID=UPI00202FBD4B|nr:translation initiation factor IF-2 [Pyrus x bretschneideri]